jgi:tricorn protease
MGVYKGYYQAPSIWKNKVVFVSEDELWHTSLSTKKSHAQRLSTGIGSISNPCISTDGKNVAFISSQEGGKEVFFMPILGGIAKRLTFFGSTKTYIVSWKNKNEIIISTSFFQPFKYLNEIFTLNVNNRTLKKIKIGTANYISYGQHSCPNQCVIQTNGDNLNYGYWKQYGGGLAGDILIDQKGDRNFKRLINIDGNLSSPIWIGNRIYFLSDHENIGGIYSCTIEGLDLTKEVMHKEFYIRQLSHDYNNLVYKSGPDIYTYNTKDKTNKIIEFHYPGSGSQKIKKLINMKEYVEDCSVHPNCDHLAVSARGKIMIMSKGKRYYQVGQRRSNKYKKIIWLKNGSHLLLVKRDIEEDTIEIYNVEKNYVVNRIANINMGIVIFIKESPIKKEFILTNHKGEILLISLSDKNKVRRIDTDRLETIYNFDWSKDGQWIIYSYSVSRHIKKIKITNIESNKSYDLSDPVLIDKDPIFSSCGEFVYFLGKREFNPRHDEVYFNISFVNETKPYLIILNNKSSSPFKKTEKALDCITSEDKDISRSNKKDTNLAIDLKNIKSRIVPFPMEDGNFQQIVSSKNKLLVVKSITNHFSENSHHEEESHTNILISYNLTTHKTEELTRNILKIISVSQDNESIFYIDLYGNIGCIKHDDKQDEDQDTTTPRDDWLDLSKISLFINPVDEWLQIFNESWRLQKDFFWNNNMNNINWKEIKQRYQSILSRIGSRSELNDLLWEMQGELKTSHAYVVGGDIKSSPQYDQGFLGAEFKYNKKRKAYSINNIIKGDTWTSKYHSPFMTPGINIQEGDFIHSIDKQKLSERNPPEVFLTNKSYKNVSIEISRKKYDKKKTIFVKALSSESQIRYKEWVGSNKEYIHKISEDKFGYIHIPNMEAEGYSEFIKYFLQECEKQALIIDVRFNSGGYISPLILEKLSRRRLGYDISRWHGNFNYPLESTTGIMVALVNEYTASDGDIFSHSFRMLNLGPLIGKRTWGGVVGIEPRHYLIDKGYTTQPEYSFFFKDIGLKVENYGVEPDIEIDNTPRSNEGGKDLQLEYAFKKIKKMHSVLKKNQR